MQQKSPVTQRELAAYFVPLALQIFTQGATHNLVAMVASRGADGALGFAGLAQANRINFLLGAFTAGLLTAGMVYGKSRAGRVRFGRAAVVAIGGVTAIHCVLNIPPVSRFIFYTLMGLPPAIARNARWAFLLGIPVQVLFAARLPSFATLFLHRATAKAYLATVVRIAFTLGLSIVFVKAGRVGVRWAMVCMVIPVAFEVVGLHVLARPYVRKLPASEEGLPGVLPMLGFAATFSVGKVLIALSNWLMAGIIARAPEPERVLPVYSVLMVLVGPIAYSATRMQALVVAFSDRDRRPQRRFALWAGTILGVVPLVVHLPLLSQWYFLGIQRLPAADMLLVAYVGLTLIPFPFLVALRSYAEGLAAVRKRPLAVLAGEITYLAAVVTTGVALLFAETPGHLIGPLGLLAGNVAAWLVTLQFLFPGVAMWKLRRAVPFLPVREG